MYRDRTLLTELLFRLVYLSDEVDEAIARLRYALFGPVIKLKLPQRTRTAVSRVRDLELA
mgnify:CR=1 FL=1